MRRIPRSTAILARFSTPLHDVLEQPWTVVGAPITGRTRDVAREYLRPTAAIREERADYLRRDAVRSTRPRRHHTCVNASRRTCCGDTGARGTSIRRPRFARWRLGRSRLRAGHALDKPLG